MTLNRILEDMRKDISNMQQTGYTKRMIQYKLNDIITKLEEDQDIYYVAKKLKL